MIVDFRLPIDDRPDNETRNGSRHLLKITRAQSGHGHAIAFPVGLVVRRGWPSSGERVYRLLGTARNGKALFFRPQLLLLSPNFGFLRHSAVISPRPLVGEY